MALPPVAPSLLLPSADEERHVPLMPMAEAQEKQTYRRRRLRTDTLSLLLCPLQSNTMSQAEEIYSTHVGKETYKFTKQKIRTQRVEELGPMLQLTTMEGG